MGGVESRPQGGGFRILKVCRNSPAERAGLEIFFDFVVQVEETCFLDNTDDAQNVFFSMLKSYKDQQMKMIVFNVRKRNVRDVYIIPSEWGGSGLLGTTVRYDDIETALTQGLRIIDVAPNSPAERAGLLAKSDYLLCTDTVLFSDINSLANLLNESIEKPFNINVYNSSDEIIRNVSIVPSNLWGGKGCVGCDIGRGYLHTIPPAKRHEQQMEAVDSEIDATALPMATTPPGENQTKDKLLLNKIQQQLNISNDIILSQSPKNVLSETSESNAEVKYAITDTHSTDGAAVVTDYRGGTVGRRSDIDENQFISSTTSKVQFPVDVSSFLGGTDAIGGFGASKTLRMYYGVPPPPRPGVIYATTNSTA